jgi:hypothetical protein
LSTTPFSLLFAGTIVNAFLFLLQIDLGAKSYGFSVRTINHAVGSLLAIGFAFRIIAVIVLVQRAKSRGYSSPKIPSTSASASSQ